MAGYLRAIASRFKSNQPRLSPPRLVFAPADPPDVPEIEFRPAGRTLTGQAPRAESMSAQPRGVQPTTPPLRRAAIEGPSAGLTQAAPHELVAPKPSLPEERPRQTSARRFEQPIRIAASDDPRADPMPRPAQLPQAGSPGIPGVTPTSPAAAIGLAERAMSTTSPAAAIGLAERAMRFGRTDAATSPGHGNQVEPRSIEARRTGLADRDMKVEPSFPRRFVATGEPVGSADSLSIGSIEVIVSEPPKPRSPKPQRQTSPPGRLSRGLRHATALRQV